LTISFALFVTGQSIPSSGTYVHRGGNMAVFTMHSFASGGFFLEPGRIGTDRIPISGKVLFARGSLWMDAADGFYIDGYVGVTENRPFTFPIGDNGSYRPIALSNAKNANAAYYGVDPNLAITSRLFGGHFPVLPEGGPYNTSSMKGDVTRVSEIEYWDINGSEFSFITLTWDENSGISELTQGNSDQLTIVGWNGSVWEEVPSSYDIEALTKEQAIPSYLDISDIGACGSITSSIPIIPNIYQAYTFACKGTKSKVMIAVEVEEDSYNNEICLSDHNSNISLNATIEICGDPSLGEISLESECIFYTPLADTNGIEVTCIQILESSGSDSIDLVITILPINDAPIARNDTFLIDNAFDIKMHILENDSDADGDVLSVYEILDFPYNGNAFIDGSHIVYSPFEDFIGVDSLTYVTCDMSLCDTAMVYIEVNNMAGLDSVCVSIETSVFLEGAYDYISGKMTPQLNDLGYLPGQKPQTFFGSKTPAGQPYHISPWHYKGDEGMDMDSDLVEEGHSVYDVDVIDYVLVSLRTENIRDSEKCRQAGLLYSDGTILLFSEETCCRLDHNRKYFLVIEHRNHLAVMSHIPLTVSENTLKYDFRNQDSYIEALGSGQKILAPEIYGLYAGNGDQTIATSSAADINVHDLSKWLIDDGLNSSYFLMDFDMNGDVNVQDKGLFLSNTGIFTDVRLK